MFIPKDLNLDCTVMQELRLAKEDQVAMDMKKWMLSPTLDGKLII